MADFYTTQTADSIKGSGPQTARYVRVLGAGVSVALILGAGIWGYKLLERSVRGVPVISAPDGPAREQPENPGGAQATHQGLAVNNVAAESGAATPPDQILLSPGDLVLQDEDVPAGQIKVEDEADPLLSRQLVINQVINQVLGGSAVTDSSDGELIASGVLAEIDPETNTVIKSPRPYLRPESFAAQEATGETEQQLFLLLARELDPETILPGARLAQLGSFDSPEEARTAWDMLYKKFNEFLAERNYVIQTAESGGHTIYRLRTDGFESLAEARRFCSTLSAEKAECIPVVIR